MFLKVSAQRLFYKGGTVQICCYYFLNIRRVDVRALRILSSLFFSLKCVKVEKGKRIFSISSVLFFFCLGAGYIFFVERNSCGIYIHTYAPIDDKNNMKKTSACTVLVLVPVE